MCPHCKHQLAWYDLLPVVSWLLLRARCRYCRHSISAQYPLVELLNGLLWVGVSIVIAPIDIVSGAQFVLTAIIFSLMLAALVYDLQTMLLPVVFTLSSIVFALLLMALNVYSGVPFSQLGNQLIAGGIFAGFFLLLWLVSRGAWIGDGDISLALLMGLVLSPSQVLIAAFFGFNLGAIVSVVLLVLKKKTRKDSIAFGPFLITGLYIGYFFGDVLTNWYLRLFF